MLRGSCSNDSSLRRMWTELLALNRLVYMLSVQFDGSHTPAKRGGQAVAYQKRKNNHCIVSD